MNELKKHIVLYISIVLIIITVTFTISYAFFQTIISGNDTAKKTEATTGNLAIDFTTSQYINDTNLMLIQDADRAAKAPYTTFTIKPTSDTNVASQYNLYLTDINISDNLKSADFKWEIIKGSTTINSGNYLNATSGTDLLLTSTPIDLSATSTGDTWIFRTWLSETNEDQLSLTNGTFSARVKVVAVVNK